MGKFGWSMPPGAWESTLPGEEEPPLSDALWNLVEEEGYTLRGFYRRLYRDSTCGFTVGFRINDKWVYNDQLPTKTLANLYDDGSWCDAIRVTGYVEGVDCEYPSRTWEGDFEEADFAAGLKEIEQGCADIWNATHGCPKCGLGFHPDYGMRVVDPNCESCHGHGEVI